MTNSIDEIRNVGCLFIIGTNTTENHPVISLEMKEAVRTNGAKMIVADPRRIDLVDYADVWNNTPASVEACRKKLERLKRYCADAGRDFESILKSLETEVMIYKDEKEMKRILRRIRELNPSMKFYRHFEECKKVYIIGTPDECLNKIKQYVELGITHFMIWFIDFPSFRGIELFAEEIIPKFR